MAIEIYRIKDTRTGKYLSTGKYSYSGFSLQKRGRLFTQLNHLKNSMRAWKTRIYMQDNKDLFPLYHHTMDVSVMYDTIAGMRFKSAAYVKQEEVEHQLRKEAKLADTWIVVDSEDNHICTLQELLDQ